MYSDKGVLKFFGGLLSLQIIVKLVKQFVKESRPIKTKTYGMPSTRSAFMFFIVTYLIFTNNLKNETKLLLVGGALLSIYMKYHLKEHTINQLLVGGLLGIGYAYLIYKV
jgi:membrane-associated phospholipid phosphatase